MLTDEEFKEAVNGVGRSFNRLTTDMPKIACVQAVLLNAGISESDMASLVDWIITEHLVGDIPASELVMRHPELGQMVFQAILSGIAIGKKIAEVTTSYGSDLFDDAEETE